MNQAAEACPVCGGNRTRVYIGGEELDLKGTAVGSSRVDVSPGRILRCQSCGFAFRSKRPSDQDLAGLYAQLDVQAYESETLGRQRTAERHLGIVKSFLPSGNILDVGCASGLFLKLAADDGWSVSGVEPAEPLFQTARNLIKDRGRILPSTLQAAALPENSFDAVTLWDVLEHVNDPLGFMRLCASLLKPGGYLFLNVPDVESLPAVLFRSRWPLLLPEHMSYFTIRSLRLCGDHAHLQWLRFGRRAAWFSLNYLFYRLAQHEVPAARLCRDFLKAGKFGNWIVPIFLGELYAVWKRPGGTA